jgi:hypothetical protein
LIYLFLVHELGLALLQIPSLLHHTSNLSISLISTIWLKHTSSIGLLDFLSLLHSTRIDGAVLYLIEIMTNCSMVVGHWIASFGSLKDVCSNAEAHHRVR